MQNGLYQDMIGHQCVITGLTHGGLSFRAGCHRLDRHGLAFEVFTPELILKSSEALSEIKIELNGHTVYRGRAIVKQLVNGLNSIVCEASLEDNWIASTNLSFSEYPEQPQRSFDAFLLASSRGQKILYDVKLVVADLLVFLLELREWICQMELRLGGSRLDTANAQERDILQDLDGRARPVMTNLFQRFEEAAKSVDPDLRLAHANYVKRLLHPLVLCSPFMYRSFQKPLGYAGDYEMVNMMMTERFRGDTSFAKILNSYFLSTPPVVAHRNRVTYLTQMLVDETCRVSMEGRRACIFNLGCGPALEIQEFLAESELSNHAEFSLFDFNDETIAHVSAKLQELRAKSRRSTSIECVKKSVMQLLKEANGPESEHSRPVYDVVYCAGLFDYLTGPVCQRLMTLFYEMLAPGGLLVATNVYAVNPSKNWMEYSVDWHLIYRDREEMIAIRPKQVGVGAINIKSDPTGLNLFLEVRKPTHG